MVKTEQNYDFRRELLTVHEANIRDFKRKTLADEFFFDGSVTIRIAADAPEVIAVAAEDFCDFLSVSMGIKATVVTEGKSDITVRLAKDAGVDLGEFAAYKGFRIETDEDGITVTAHDDRGAQQALFYIEDLMTFAHAPCLAYGKIEKRAMYTPQMVHSAYGIDEFPDEYLARIAHEGRDAILVFTKGANQANDFPLDFNELIRRASRYGIDVYAYSKMRSNVHVDDEGAEEYYDALYGELFRKSPGLKGVTLVGEAIGMPRSRDPRVDQNMRDGIPVGKPTPGYFPCLDYVDLLELLKKIIRKENPDADIVFWTYNWAKESVEDRLALIDALPTDISLQATFEMGEMRPCEDSVIVSADYSLAFEGPGVYFRTEAEAAKRRGIRLYSMTNSGGRTWDFGCIPFEPMAQSWIRRYEAMRHAHDDWGLTGLMECHHYGFYPSIISKLSKHLFMIPTPNAEEMLMTILRAEYGEENAETVYDALNDYSEALCHYTATDPDQYGAFRIGPAQPLNLLQILHIPFDEGASYGHSNWRAQYLDVHDKKILTNQTPQPVRLPDEIKSLEKMLAFMEEGTEKLRAIRMPNAPLARLLNLGHFVTNTVKTGIAAKKMYVLKMKLLSSDDPVRYGDLLDEIEVLQRKEKENVLDTIPLVEADSALGFEASMLYVTDRRRLEWKLRQIDFVIGVEMKEMREGLALHMENFAKKQGEKK